MNLVVASRWRHGGRSGHSMEEKPWESERECALVGGRSGPMEVELAWWRPEEAGHGGHQPWVAVHGGARRATRACVSEEP